MVSSADPPALQLKTLALSDDSPGADNALDKVNVLQETEITAAQSPLEVPAEFSEKV